MVLNAEILFSKYFMDFAYSLKVFSLFYFMHWLLHKKQDGDLSIFENLMKISNNVF